MTVLEAKVDALADEVGRVLRKVPATRKGIKALIGTNVEELQSLRDEINRTGLQALIAGISLRNYAPSDDAGPDLVSKTGTMLLQLGQLFGEVAQKTKAAKAVRTPARPEPWWRLMRPDLDKALDLERPVRWTSAEFGGWASPEEEKQRADNQQRLAEQRARSEREARRAEPESRNGEASNNWGG